MLKFPERESKLLEFKAQVPQLNSLVKTCIAFANGAGGRIIIGIEDESQNIIGVTDADRVKIYDNFPNSLYDSTTPSLTAQIYEQSFGKQSVLIIEIPPSPRKPYFLSKKGAKDGTYVRIGSSTRKANQEHIEDLSREAHRIHFDEEAVRTGLSSLSQDLLHAFFNANVSKQRLLSEKIITNLPANRETYHPTVAGTLMFSEAPEYYIPEALIRCTRFKGTQGRDILKTEDITGTIEQQAAQAHKLITTWVSSHYELQGVKLNKIPTVPEIALREAIINALLHRKYNVPGATKMAVYDDRLEIFNPGDFPGIVDINTLGDGTTYLRNPNLVRLAYKQGLIETRGTGIRLIFDSCKKAGIKKPCYDDEGDFVKVTFYFAPDTHQYKNDEATILHYFETREIVSAKEIASLLSVSHNTAIRKLKALITKQKLKQIGQGPSIKYTLIR